MDPTLSTTVTLIIVVCLFLIIVGVGIVILVLVYQKRQLQYLREREQLKVMFEKEILESRLEMQEQTFKNISQEIHDNIGQLLSLAKLNISTMDTENPKDVQEKKEDSRVLIGKAIQDLRDLSRSMNTDFVSEIGLLKAVAYELQLLKKASSYTTDLQMEGEPVRLPAQQELIVFRIFQEVLNNIIKHAKASCITVQLRFNPHRMMLQVTDNGQGFLAPSYFDGSAPPNSLGIRNMQNRARMIGAGFFLESSPGAGTSVTLHIPLNAQTATT
jgi:two-component system NarL family sensor kinase